MLRREVATPVDVMVDPEKLRPVDMPLLVGDHTRLTNATGWEPEVPLARTLRDILAEQRALVRNCVISNLTISEFRPLSEVEPGGGMQF